jgi:hypothetical protein
MGSFLRRFPVLLYWILPVMRLPEFNVTPIIAPLLRSRAASLGLLTIGAVQVGAVALGISGWQCPMRAMLHLPCPGCGLTRAVMHCLRGDWQAGLQYHLFAPVVIVFLLTLICSGVFPTIPRLKIITGIEVLERRFGLAALLLIGLMLYWILRLLFWRETFFRLVL